MREIQYLIIAPEGREVTCFSPEAALKEYNALAERYGHRRVRVERATTSYKHIPIEKLRKMTDE